MKVNVENPILPGSNPDPSILKVNGVYYIAVSTFSWQPGVRVYASQDLVNWVYYTDILTDTDLISLEGNPDNGSVWAPQISYKDGLYYLVYTNVTSSRSPFKDNHNYVIYAKDLKGPWSKPVYLNSRGFDPSLFHDDDGKTWLLNCVWDYRKQTPNKSIGIEIQELDLESFSLIDKPVHLFYGTKREKTEAPHIYKIKDWYYLITAEGGTGLGHCVTVCRSKNLLGPYEVDPNGPILSSSHQPDWPIQCAGHASLIQNNFGDYYIVHLGTRPILGKYPILGRETFIQEVEIVDAWIRLKSKDILPSTSVKITSPFPKKEKSKVFYQDFSKPLSYMWNSLRIFQDDKWIMQNNEGLTLLSQESPHSLFKQSLLAIRQTDIVYEVEITLDFYPENSQQMAGLIHYLSSESYIFLYKTYDEDKGPVLRLMKNEHSSFTLYDTMVPVGNGEIKIKFVTYDGVSGSYFYKNSRENMHWIKIYDNIDIGFLSGGFTGNYIGIACYDLHILGGSTARFVDFKCTNEKGEII